MQIHILFYSFYLICSYFVKIPGEAVSEAKKAGKKTMESVKAVSTENE